MEPAVLDERKRPSFLTDKQRAEAAQVAFAMRLMRGASEDELREALSSLFSTAAYAKERAHGMRPFRSHTSFAQANPLAFEKVAEQVIMEVARASPARCVYCIVRDAAQEHELTLLEIPEVFARAENCA